jgi:(S)-2-hydroxyglutarate dehydrogenase
MTASFDVAIIGAGIVGLATAMKLSTSATLPALRIAVLDKEPQPACHQTSHNSGVIHSGLYYRPGSLKAHTCLSGAEQLLRFCEQQGIRFERCGKVVVATDPEEIPRLQELQRRGQANGVPGLRLLGAAQLREIEPYAHGLQALHVPTTGIVDFAEVTRAYARVFQQRGGTLLLRHRVVGLQPAPPGVRVETSQGELETRVVINCAGLYADRLARLAGLRPNCQIVPFRGEYYRIKSERRHLVRNLIYPVPDPRLPFLGVHFTRLLDGTVEAGPNAILAWAREGYRKTTVCWPELAETLRFRGFRRMARRYWRAGVHEMLRSYSKNRFAHALQRLVPALRGEDLEAGGAGVRAQALDEHGRLLDDFVILKSQSMVHVLNAPSPAATSALAIADQILRSAGPLLT